MHKMQSHPSVTAVVLTYNSVDDLPHCLDGLLKQQGCDLRICVVDNASAAENREALLATAYQKVPDIEVVSAADARTGVVDRAGRAFYVQNNVNAGYSAGNNIGARLAAELGCEAVLILNPDVRVHDTGYVAGLVRHLFADRDVAVAASAIRNLAGDNENPMQELGFVEELCWPLSMVLARLGWRLPSLRSRAATVEKVSGCCLLVRIEFLRTVGFFDENVFLYCEEAILGVQVRRLGLKITYAHDLEAVHAHVSSAKGDPTWRVSQWIRSRRYYHAHYSGYGPLRRSLLRVSQGAVRFLLQAQHRFSRRR
jgi:GT2 family glycosyltransferase